MFWGESQGLQVKQVVIALAAGLLGWGLTGLTLVAMRSSRHLALPTDRGLHKVPTPVGGGIGLIGASVLLWMLLAWPLPGGVVSILSALVALAAVSWVDDRTPLPPAVRFATQAIVVCGVVLNLPADVRLYSNLPLALERAGLGVFWLWMLNLTNFMDGIDGLAGSEAVTVGLGYAILSYLFPARPIIPALPELGLILAASAIGYLYWNWAPAKIFMGDVGSIPLGFLFGLMMLDLARRGLWSAALILPLYFIADATSTLLNRLRLGAKPWQAHREHAYQHAVMSGMTHGQVTAHVAVLNAALAALAIVSAKAPWAALAAASLMTAGLMAWFRARGLETSSTSETHE